MPHTESAKKRLRQTKRKTLANRILRGSVRTTEKRLRELVAKGDPKTAATLLPSAYQFLDKAAKNRVIHPNTAANHKAKLARMVARAGAKPAAK
jgi:small subunit ribosomal protein S20